MQRRCNLVPCHMPPSWNLTVALTDMKMSESISRSQDRIPEGILFYIHMKRIQKQLNPFTSCLLCKRFSFCCRIQNALFKTVHNFQAVINSILFRLLRYLFYRLKRPFSGRKLILIRRRPLHRPASIQNTAHHVSLHSIYGIQQPAYILNSGSSGCVIRA